MIHNFPILFLKARMEPLEWPHCFATIDISTLGHGVKFCEKEGNNIVSLRIFQLVDNQEETNQMMLFLAHKVSIGDVTHTGKETRSKSDPKDLE